MAIESLMEATKEENSTSSIQIGTIFEHKPDPSHPKPELWMVRDMNKDGTFNASQIIQEPTTGELKLGSGGTRTVDHIQKIVDKASPDQVLKLIKDAYLERVPDATPEQVENLLSYYRQRLETREKQST